MKFILRLHNQEGDKEEQAKYAFRRFLIEEGKNLKICYYRFDTDGRGKILVEDIKYVMKNLPVVVTDEEVEDMIREGF